MTPEAMARLHDQCFDEAPRAWSAHEFAELLASPGVFATGDKLGFALGRIAGPEVELLTLAVAPARRRHGIGRELMASFEEAGLRGGAEESFLEVAENNAAARALYTACGYGEVARRRAYYRRQSGRAVDALVLRKVLGR